MTTQHTAGTYLSQCRFYLEEFCVQTTVRWVKLQETKIKRKLKLTLTIISLGGRGRGVSDIKSNKQGIYLIIYLDHGKIELQHSGKPPKTGTMRDHITEPQ